MIAERWGNIRNEVMKEDEENWDDRDSLDRLQHKFLQDEVNEEDKMESPEGVANWDWLSLDIFV